MSAIAERITQDVDSEGTHAVDPTIVPLSQFIADFGDGLLEAVQRQNPPVYDGTPNPRREAVMDRLKRDPFPAQREVVQAVTRLLMDAGEPAAVINAEMGTGKTMMAISTAAVMHAEGARRILVLSPPHLVYKWRREILETIHDARVWVLNGPDTLRKLLQLRAELGASPHPGPEFFILGRVRMRMGFHWKPAFWIRKFHVRLSDQDDPESKGQIRTLEYATCPRCGMVVKDVDDESISALAFPSERMRACVACGEALWTLMRPKGRQKSRDELVVEAMCRIPTIGPKTAAKLVGLFGADLLEAMLASNVYEFINLMDGEGELVFSDRQAARMERAMANLEFGFGQGGYQPTEFIKKYLPDGYFDLMVVDLC
jgi:hypothetical protein